MLERYDALIVGAGAAGLSAALAARAIGMRVCIVGRFETPPAGRTIALLDGSIQFFRALGLEEPIAARSAPLARMRIVDDTDTLFYVPPVIFESSEINLPAFGRNIANGPLLDLLADAVEENAIAFEKTAPDAICATGAGVEIHLGERRLIAPLAIGADGRRSKAREGAHMRVREWRYPQSAIAAILSHDLPHEDISTEFHTRAGPFTLVPMQDTKEGAHRSSLVWMTQPEAARGLMELSNEAFAQAAERQAHALLGRMALTGPRSLAPIIGLRSERLAARRVALVGDAAHVLPPIGAQGLNLGLRDVAVLIERLAGASDPGADWVLQSYDRARRADVDLRAAGVDILNRSLLANLPAVDLARGLGLQALAWFGPLRRAAMRGGIQPFRHPLRLGLGQWADAASRSAPSRGRGRSSHGAE